MVSKVGGGIHRLDFAIDHYAGAVITLGSAHMMGDNEYGDTLYGGVVYHISKLTVRYGVHPSGRPVEEHNFRTTKDSHKEGELLLPAQR